jgi:hypothetical protein
VESRRSQRTAAPYQRVIKSMEMLPGGRGAFFAFSLLSIVSTVTCAVAVARIPTSLVMYGALIFTVLVCANVMQWLRRNSGSIAFTSDELIVTPRSGAVRRRYFSEIVRIERYSAEVSRPWTVPMVENYVRIVCTDKIPLQFLWETAPLAKKKNPADVMVENLGAQMPAVEILTNPEPLETIKVDFVLRGVMRHYAGSVRLFAVFACGFGGFFLNVMVPKSYGSANNALKPIEQSLKGIRRTVLKVENSTLAYGVSCYGENGRDSYWEEDFFGLEIRYFTFNIAVHSDEKSAEARSRKILPKDWVVSAWDATPDPSGDTHVNVESPCFTAEPDQFDSVLSDRAVAIAQQIRTTVERP